VLGKNQTTRQYVELYYVYGAEVNRILSRDAVLREDVRKCIVWLLPSVRKMLHSASLTFTGTQKIHIKNCLKKISKRAGPDLRKEIEAFVNALENDRLFAD